jgi:hypothetical protein
MSYNFGLYRLALFGACIALFFFLGGFDWPEVGDDSLMNPAQVHKAWMWCVVMFLVGAGSVALVDHNVGLMEPANLRLLYIIIGVLLMAGSFIWQRSLKQGAAGPESNRSAVRAR